MTQSSPSEDIVWTPQMPDRRKNDRRGDVYELQTNGKPLNVSHSKAGDERRRVPDRRKKVSVTITGRAMDVADYE